MSNLIFWQERATGRLWKRESRNLMSPQLPREKTKSRNDGSGSGLGPLMCYLRAISTSLPEGDGSLAISGFVASLGTRNFKPALPCTPQIWVRKYRFPRC